MTQQTRHVLVVFGTLAVLVLIDAIGFVLIAGAVTSLRQWVSAS